MERPETQYVSVGHDRVAYQVFGDGPSNVLFLLNPLGSVESLWDYVGHLRIWRVAAAHGRAVLFDPRGFGMSDAIDGQRIGDPNLCVADALAVLDTLGMSRVSVMSESLGGLNAITFAVAHPERVERLALMNASWAGPAFGSSAADLDVIVELMRDIWGTGAVLGSVPRFRENDPRFIARFERMSARPSAAAAYVRNTAAVDVRPLLSRISAPTIVGIDSDHQGPQDLTAELAERIPDVRVVEGDNTSFYWGSGIVETAFAFLSGEAATGNRELATILFTDIVGSTRSVAAVGDAQWRQTLDFLDDLVEARAVSAGGRIVKQTGDGHVIEFTRPGDAVKAALAICHDAPTLGVQLRAGIHTGEIERRERGDIGGLSVHVAARVAAIAGPGELVISRTVADLLGSAEHTLLDRGEHELKGVPSRWQLFTVTD